MSRIEPAPARLTDGRSTLPRLTVLNDKRDCTGPSAGLRGPGRLRRGTRESAATGYWPVASAASTMSSAMRAT
jgi:hypothetical protein